MSARTVWILTGGRVGDLRQMEALATALGWPTVIKRLSFRRPALPLFAEQLLDRSKSDPLAPPWPDLMLCAEAMTSVIARHVGAGSNRSTKIVCLGRPSGDPGSFDLVISTPQYRLANAPNVLELSLPLGVNTAQRPRRSSRTHPVMALLVGGTAPPEILDETAAHELVSRAIHHARKRRAQLTVLTSPRTSSRVADVLAMTIVPPDVLHVWTKDAPSPYRQVLAEADEIIVTSDSVSMAAEAVATGNPVWIYRLPRRWNFGQALAERLYRSTSGDPGRSPWLKRFGWVFTSGLIEACPDRPLLFDRLAAEGRVAWLGSERAAQQRPSLRDLDMARAAIERLFD
jgi:mitochondrial fission protein ELM1